MTYKKKVVAVIPAKGDSRRLKDKNMALLLGRPMLYYTIKQAKECKAISGVYVSTDSKVIADAAKKMGAGVIMRPKELCMETPVVEVYRHALSQIPGKKADFIIALQPDHPDRRVNLNEVIAYCIENNLDDLISVDAQGRKNGSIRMIKVEALKNKGVSVCTGSVMDTATNIHTLNDLKAAEISLKNAGAPVRIEIMNKIISAESKTFVIAEGACNHMCDMHRARAMIDEAKAAGADAIKFQTYKAQRLVTRQAKVYWNYGSVKTQLEYYRTLDRFDIEEYRELFHYAKSRKIIAFSSPFDIKSAEMLNKIGSPLFKIASCLIPDLRLIRRIAGFAKPVILSTGGSTLQEIQDAVNAIYMEGNHRLILMACTLSYPTNDQDAHIRRIRKLCELFPEAIIGYSDHTQPDPHMVIPALAVSMGARVIEKHFTLDRSLTGSGHSFSVDAAALRKMIENIRLCETVLGSESIEVRKVEDKSRASARTSIVAQCDIRRGEVIKEKMLFLKRPGDGLPPSAMDKIIGKRAIRDIRADEYLTWKDVAE